MKYSIRVSRVTQEIEKHHSSLFHFTCIIYSLPPLSSLLSPSSLSPSLPSPSYLALPAGATATLQFTGQASVSEYETLLLSLTYVNTASEPTSGNRSIAITLSDGVHQDMTAVIVIVILQNDSPLTVQASETRLRYVEGDQGLAVGALSGVTLVDEDRDAVIRRLTISLSGGLESSSESLVVDTSSVVPGGGLVLVVAGINFTATSSLQNYQV